MRLKKQKQYYQSLISGKVNLIGTFRADSICSRKTTHLLLCQTYKPLELQSPPLQELVLSKWILQLSALNS